jgi:rSAM/selenodomain-associated transferase 2
MKLSIIIPVLNEETAISELLNHLNNIKNPEFTSEIIVIDGGSIDKTQEILKSYPEIKVLFSEKGRAKQMNFGAKNAHSEILYFLHCDTFPPLNFDSEIVNQVQNSKLSGCFKMKFDNNHIVLKVSQWFTRFNFQAFRGGDQSLFVKRNLFEKLNGFNEKLIIYEDNELIARLYKNSKFTVIQKTVTTSARKYLKNGIWKLQFHFLMIHIKFWLGSSQEKLVKYYVKNIM